MPGAVQGKFADPAVEARFQQSARTLRLPFVRIYGVLFMLVALAYTIANPMFVHPHDTAKLALLLGCTLLLAGAYIGSTFWSKYVEQPALDFAALLGIVFLIGHINLILFDELIDMQEQMHAVGVINRLSVSAFAAVALAGRPRLFLLWLALDFTVFLATVMPVQSHGAGLWYALLSYLSGALIMVAINVAIDRSSRGAFALAEALEAERAKNEALVYNMLPQAAVERIRDGRVVADSYADASVIFIDMVGFTKLAQRVSPGTWSSCSTPFQPRRPLRRRASRRKGQDDRRCLSGDGGRQYDEPQQRRRRHRLCPCGAGGGRRAAADRWGRDRPARRYPQRSCRRRRDRRDAHGL